MNPTPLQHLISELKRRSEEASPAPWECRIRNGRPALVVPHGSDYQMTIAKFDSFEQTKDKNDAELCAFLRNHCGKLAEMLEVAVEALQSSAESGTSSDDAEACNHPYDAADALAKLTTIASRP